jgi:hypothetical protein
MPGIRFIAWGLAGLFSLGPFVFADNVSTLRLPVEAKPASEKWTAEWELFMGGNGFTEGKDEGVGALLYFKANFQHQFAPWLKASIKPRADLFAGRAQERYDNDTFQNRIRLIEGYLAVQPVDFVEVRAGAINQAYLESPMLISSHRAFPGVQEILSFQDGGFKAELIGQQTVPTSYSLNTERDEKEGVPTFTTESAHLSGKLDWFEVNAVGGHFAWRSIPDKVAFESAVTGNRVVGEVAPGARFVNRFDGWFMSADACACFRGPVQFVAEYQRILNRAAQGTDRDAQSIGGGPRLIFGDRELEIRYRSYFIESDATVGAYNRSLLGNTNRMGDDIEFKLDFKDHKFALVGEWLNARTIRDNATQKTMTVYYIGVETSYAPF